MKYLLLAITCLILFACSSEEVTPINPNDPVNPTEPTLVKAPAFSLATEDGGTISLDDFKDDVLVIFFFGYNCSPCVKVAPSIESDLHQEFASNDNFSMIGIDVWNGNDAAVQAFRTNTGVTFPLGTNGSEVVKSYQSARDRLVIVNKAGEIAYSGNTQATNDLSIVISQVGTLLND